MTRSILYITILFLAVSCTSYQDFDKQKSYIFDLNNSSQIAIGPDNWKGTQDCSATAYMSRTETGLLLTIRVKDDSVRTGNEFSYMNDGVEIYMDLRPPRLRKKNVYEKGVFQAVIIPLPGKKNVAPIEWYPKNYNSEVTGATAWTQLFDSSYVVQLYLPYSGLKRSHYWPRTNFSIDIAINDADSVNRETQMVWRGKADNWNNPLNFMPITVLSPEDEVQRSRKKKSANPNILFILTDQQTISAMSAYGNPYIQTPNMDALAAAGTRFTQSYCTSPDCSPSKSSLFTGLYPHQTKVNHNGNKPDSTILNMGQIFRKNGYSTIFGGKWQLPDDFPHITTDSIPGFDVVNFLSAEKTTGSGINTDSPLADAMAKQLQRHPESPWLMVVSFQNPHDITNVTSNPGGYLPSVNPMACPPLPSNYQIPANEPQFILDSRERKTYENSTYISKPFTPENWRNYIFQYYRLVEKTDFEIGKLIQMLEKQGYDENTLIVLTSDHGDGTASHKWAGSLSPYQESLKVPLIFSWFGKTFESEVDNAHLVSGIDILPTMLSFANLSVPTYLEGINLKPLIENSDSLSREFLYSEIAQDPAFPERLARVVLYKNYKYILYSYGKNNEQLFDLKNDPGEMNDLAGTGAHQQIKNFMRSQLNIWMKEKTDYFKEITN